MDYIQEGPIMLDVTEIKSIWKNKGKVQLIRTKKGCEFTKEEEELKKVVL